MHPRPATKSATELATAICQLAEVTAREVTDEHLARIDAVDGSIHANAR